MQNLRGVSAAGKKPAREEAAFVVRDEGRGFDPSSLPDPTDPANLENLCGRGVLLMRMLMDGVLYSPTGNEVTLVKRRRAAEGPGVTGLIPARRSGP